MTGLKIHTHVQFRTRRDNIEFHAALRPGRWYAEVNSFRLPVNSELDVDTDTGWEKRRNLGRERKKLDNTSGTVMELIGK